MDYTINAGIDIPAQLPQIHVSYSASVRTAAAIRERLKRAIEHEWEQPFTVHCEEFLHSVGEASTNAWRHGCQMCTGTVILLDATFDPDTRTIVVEISDPGPGFDTSLPFRRDKDLDICASGRFFMSIYSDQVEYLRCGEWHVCRLIKHL